MPDIQVEVINTTGQIGNLVDWLILRQASREPHQTSIYIDLEAIDLVQGSSLAILSILADTGNSALRAYLVDVHELGLDAFSTIGIKNRSLKDILQHEKIPKVVFDATDHSISVLKHYGVAIRGVHDVQLMGSTVQITTTSAGKNVLYQSDLTNWKQKKEERARLSKAEDGGSCQAFIQRPMSNEIISYCVTNVCGLPKLWDRFQQDTDMWRHRIDEQNEKKHVAVSHKLESQSHGRDKILAPWRRPE